MSTQTGGTFMQKITPFLWFDNNLDEALAFYLSIFRQAKVTYQQKGPDGKTFTAAFELEGQGFMGLNGGPHYKLTPAVSFSSPAPIRRRSIIIGTDCWMADRRSNAAG
jgi:predicted 3-demethylubiquinone-9 3-methyltransferase (glyoxalase superfamily)